MRRIGLAMQLAGILAMAVGVAFCLTALFATDVIAIASPPAAGDHPWEVVPVEGSPALPRVVTPGNSHEVAKLRITPIEWERGVASVTVDVYLILSPAGKPVPATPAEVGPQDWVFVKREVFLPGEGSRDVPLETDFTGLPVPPGNDGYGSDWTARLGHLITYEYTDGRVGAPQATPGGVTEGVRVAPSFIQALLAPGDVMPIILEGGAIFAAGAGISFAGVRRFRYENRTVQIRPVMSSGARPPDT